MTKTKEVGKKKEKGGDKKGKKGKKGKESFKSRTKKSIIGITKKAVQKLKKSKKDKVDKKKNKSIIKKKDKKSEELLALALASTPSTSKSKSKSKSIKNEATSSSISPMDVEIVKKVKKSSDNDDKTPKEFFVSCIATPLAGIELTKNLFKLIQKASEAKQVSRGVKEVVKFIRKGGSIGGKKFNAIIILAGDVSPIDVISHLPILCEENSIPYIYVNSRDALGRASLTKRPTSVVMVRLASDSKYSKLFKKCQDEVASALPSV